MAKQDDWVRLTVRMPPELYEQLQAIVASGPRSMNAEIVSRLQQTLDAPSARPRSDVLTPEGLSLMRSYAAETKQTLQELLAALDQAEAVLLPKEAPSRTTPTPD